MKNTAIKVCVALVFASLIVSLGAASQRDIPPQQENTFMLLEQDESPGARDAVIYEIERFYLLWRKHDTGTSCRESTQGNS